MTRKAFYANNTRILCWGIGFGLMAGVLVGTSLH